MRIVQYARFAYKHRRGFYPASIRGRYSVFNEISSEVGGKFFQNFPPNGLHINRQKGKPRLKCREPHLTALVSVLHLYLSKIAQIIDS